MSYCNVSSSDYPITFFTPYNRFFQKHDGLSDGRVVLMTKNEYGSEVKFLHRLLKLLKSISGE